LAFLSYRYILRPLRFLTAAAVSSSCIFLGLVGAAWAAGPSPDAAPSTSPTAASGASAPDSASSTATPSTASGAQGLSAHSGAVTRPAPDAFRSKAPKKPPESNSHPLSSTPYLGAFRYVFPVVGSVAYGDSYGALRSDVPGKWHHGDDLFAPLGAPVVAVAAGRLDKLGWNKIGGWRVWLHDAAGNSFYYAHLSAYSRAALHTSHVEAGQVIGFIGDTGDAISTPYHLHFEVHPAVYSYLGEDGAVDPTSYLSGWQHLGHVAIPKPALPRMPDGYVGDEARRAFEQLLTVPALVTAYRHQAKVRQQLLQRQRRAAVAARRTLPLPRSGAGRRASVASSPLEAAGPFRPPRSVAHAGSSMSSLEIGGVVLAALALLVGIAAFAGRGSLQRGRVLRLAAVRVRSRFARY
jgi:murein DD-endopeptidase MepM/ murein hydrolase activator NlpD